MQVMAKIPTTDNANQTEAQAQMLKKRFIFAFEAHLFLASLHSMS